MAKEWYRTLGKGFAMGACDVVPGVSGGTIAFITGIYERLMDAVSGTFHLAREAITWPFTKRTERLKQALGEADLGFLGTLLLGIAAAFLIGSRAILYLMEHHFAYTISFFLGLITASAVSIAKHITKRSLPNAAALVAGLALGLSFLLYAPLAITPSTWYLFISGFLAVAALFLPGISGSFILLLLGVYEYVLSLLQDLTGSAAQLAIFITGAGLGAYVISRAVKWLFRTDKAKTLHFLLGLVIGSLGVPAKRLIVAGIPHELVAAGFALLGFIAVILIERGGKA